MYDDITTEAKKADNRVSLMQQFVDLSDAIDREHREAKERAEKVTAMTKERDALRRKLDSIINPDQPVETEMADYR